MENENGQSYYGIHIDVEPLKQEAQEAVETIATIPDAVASEIERVHNILNQPLPKIDLDVEANTDGLVDTEQILEEVNRVAQENSDTLQELREANEALGETLSDTSSLTDEQKEALEELQNELKEGIEKREEYGKQIEASRESIQNMTVATKEQTAMQKVWQGALGATRVALNAVKATLMSLGIGLITTAVAGLVTWLIKLADSSSEAAKKAEEQRKINEKGNEAYIKASVQIQDYQRRLESFNGTKKEEAAVVKELNQNYGQALGYYKSVSEWKEVLKTKGQQYCEMLMMEARAQAMLNKYTEAYVKLQTVKSKAEAGEYDATWYNPFSWFGDSADEAIADAQKEVDQWKNEYEKLQTDLTKFKEDNQLDFHVDPTKGNKGTKFDAKAAALRVRKAQEAYRDAVKEYVKDANDQITEMAISSQEEGLVKEINSINYGTQQKLAAWQKQIDQLAKVRKNVAKQQFLNQKGAKEEDWYKTADGKKSDADWVQTIKKENPSIDFEGITQQIISSGDKAIAEVRKKYQDALIDEFGTSEQKLEKLEREWAEKLAFLPPEFMDEAVKKMNEEFANLDNEQFKLQIDWEGVFGDLSKQALPSLQLQLAKVSQYFEQNKKSMSVTEIKDYEEAITKLQNEIADRNPFTALHKSLKDIGTAKEEYNTALTEWKQKNDELNQALSEQKQARQELNDVNQQIEDGDLVQGCKEQTDAYEKLKKANEKVTKTRKAENQASNQVIRTQNKVTASYKNFSSNLTRVGSVIQNLGGKAKNLASIFSDDVAASMEKALDFTEQILDATTTVIDAIGDTGKSVAEGVEKTVEATSAGATASATTAATAIATVEKASAILAIISAAIQVATAIANLFNNDAAKQKEIESLQERIDQLQWELDHKDAVRLQQQTGDAVEKLRKVYAATTQEIIRLHAYTERYGSYWGNKLGRIISESEIYQKTVEKIANAYASVAYTADKALGEKRFKDSRKDLENLAQQQILIQKQIDAENDKKKTDHGKITEWENQIREIAEEMATLINEMVEEIIGGTAQDIASQLGEAFFEAAQAGEDAMEAWHLKVNEIIADIIQRMIITQYLEPEIGKIFDKYKKQWFGTDGNFKGISAVIASADQMAEDINNVGTIFNGIYSGLSESLEKYFPVLEEAAEREGAQKGIANASQESVDELNGRMTAVQGHTYSIAENTKLLLQNTTLILRSVLNIEGNTNGLSSRMETVERDVREVRNTINDIALRGLKIKS